MKDIDKGPSTPKNDRGLNKKTSKGKLSQPKKSVRIDPELE
jgi:hypothetical protein